MPYGCPPLSPATGSLPASPTETLLPFLLQAMAVITLLVQLLKSIIQHTQPVGDEVDEAVGEDMQQRAAQPSQEMMQLLQEVKEPEQRSPEQSGFGWPALLFAAWQQWQFWATAGLLALLFGLCWWLRKRSPEVDSSGKEESSSRDTEREEEQPPIGVGSTFEGWSPCEDDAVYCLLVPPCGHAFHLELGTPGEMPAKMQQMELPRKHAAVQFLGCRECLSSSDNTCVRWDQVDDLLSLVTELRAEVKRLRSIRECEMEIDRWSNTLAPQCNGSKWRLQTRQVIPHPLATRQRRRGPKRWGRLETGPRSGRQENPLPTSLTLHGVPSQ